MVAKDKNADDVFFYGVMTTGVYCRPSCASRLPLRTNVEFFPSCKEAESAGYRACKRCTPGSNAKHNDTKQKIIQACRLIEKSEDSLTLKELAEKVGLSPYYFHRLFKQLVGVTPKQYAATHQALRFRKNLASGQSVTEALYFAGYSSSSGVYNKKLERLAMTPGHYRKGAIGATISYGIEQCSLGWVIVGATTRGVCAVLFADEPESLVDLLQKSFPKAKLQKGGSDFAALLNKTVAYIDSPHRNCTIPLDIQGTAFQQKVWSALRQIDIGETLSYSEVAKRIGKPKAFRAVATACSANTIAVLVPCHRVIGKDGKSGGYRWGTTRKKLLLRREGVKGQ